MLQVWVQSSESNLEAKNCIVKLLGKYYCKLGRTQAKRGTGKQEIFFIRETGGASKGVALGKFHNFYPHLSLETVLSVIKVLHYLQSEKIWVAGFFLIILT